MFVSSPTIRLLKYFQGQTCHGCINHDIIVGLWFELLMRLSYYIHLWFGKKLSSYVGIEPGPNERESSTLPLDLSGNFFCKIAEIQSFKKLRNYLKIENVCDNVCEYGIQLYQLSSHYPYCNLIYLPKLIYLLTDKTW